MKKIFAKAAAVLTCAFLLGQSSPVYAAETPVIEMKSGEIKEGDTQVRVSCDISGESGVTSGKIRIKYDGEKLKLESTSAGDALAGAMCEINDCLSGNKEEGEIVVAFATATPLTDGGSLVEMNFQLDSGVKAGDKLEITAGAEQLAADGEDVAAEVKQLTVEVGSAVTPTPSPTPGGDENNGDDENGGGNQGDDGNGGGGQGDDGSKGDGSGKPSGGGQNDKNGNSGNKKSPKTGDVTDVAAPIVASGAALLGIVALAAWKKKSRV